MRTEEPRQYVYDFRDTAMKLQLPLTSLCRKQWSLCVDPEVPYRPKFIRSSRTYPSRIRSSLLQFRESALPNRLIIHR
jgi:hypothetical protein